MTINKDQLRQLIAETLKNADLYSDDAVELLMGTSAQESHLGSYIHQINGPALGIFQMEPATAHDIWTNYLKYKPGLVGVVKTVMTGNPNELAWNLKYAILMARIHYLRVKAGLPDSSNVHAMALYWKQYYNTPLGRGTAEEFAKNYARYAANES